MQKLFVTGISGFVGWHVAHFQQNNWAIIGSYGKNAVNFPGVTAIPLDLSKPDFIKTIAQEQPDAVLHLAALANPNFCEENETLAKQINVDASILLANFCKKNNIPLLFASTDLVFDGKHAPYTENAQPDAVSVYGKQKSLAESCILEVYPQTIVARLPLMYGKAPGKITFFSKWLTNLREGASIGAFTDEWRTAAYVGDVVAGMFLLLEKASGGFWHLGGPKRMSRYEFALQLARSLGADEKLVSPVKRAAIPMPAKRPEDVSLDSRKANALGYQPGKFDPAKWHDPSFQ